MNEVENAEEGISRVVMGKMITERLISIASANRHVKPKFQYFLNQHSNVYLEKDERQALRTRKHYTLIFSG